MIDLDAMCGLVGLEATVLERWIGERWVLPETEGGAYVFHEVDVARVRLIVEMRRDLALDEEAIPVVLRLLDQVYALRRRLRAVTGAIESLPPELRAAVMARIEGVE
ncbi:MAG TPA: chaperone modulator CbpM [Stellaceae bacterium]|nr:chaperone modulator CbpM [Stellaceae bacterium]